MTESGVNCDYAFLTNLERDILRPVDMVERDSEEGDGKERKSVDRLQIRESVQELLKMKNITVKWAPWDGFKRAKENQTRVAP